jgi:hypothetical protein
VLAFKRLGHAERIFCLIVGGERTPAISLDAKRRSAFAPALRFEIGADGQPTQQRTEPIAADARVGKDGKANAKLKLIAGLLDVGFDALKQRELQRRNRRLAIVTAAALVVMAITTTLAITAVIARNDAERRQKQAEDLVGFMLGDLNDKTRSSQPPRHHRGRRRQGNGVLQVIADFRRDRRSARTASQSPSANRHDPPGSRPLALQRWSRTKPR